MGKRAPSQPAPPDPARTAAAQAAANKETAIAEAHLNMIDQVTPYGTLEYTPRGVASDDTPQYTATQTLAPDQQRMLDLTNQAGIKYGETANRQLEAVSDRLAAPLDFTSRQAKLSGGGVPLGQGQIQTFDEGIFEGPLPSPGDPPTSGGSGLPPPAVANEATRLSIRDSLLERMRPSFDRDREALETRLANQGFTSQTKGYKDEFDELNRSITDTRLAADAQAGNEMSRMFALESAARNQGINEMVQQRQIPLNELAAMLSGTQVQQPQFINPPQAQLQSPDLLGATYANYAGQQNAYNQRVAQQNAMTGGLFGLGSSALLAGLGGGGFLSDRRLKTNIRKIGELLNGIGVYLFNYIWGGPVWTGVMADEVKKVLPGAVFNVGGFDVVNYSEVLEASQ